MSNYALVRILVLRFGILTLLLDKRLTSAVVGTGMGFWQRAGGRACTSGITGVKADLLDSLKFDVPFASSIPRPCAAPMSPLISWVWIWRRNPVRIIAHLTLPIEVRNNRLQQVSALNAANNPNPSSSPYGQGDSEKMAQGNTRSLPRCRCRPATDGFIIAYRRYFPTRQGWQVRKRTQPGFFGNQIRISQMITSFHEQLSWCG